MSAIKNIAVTVAVIAVVGSAGFIGYRFWKTKGVALTSSTVYVMRVQEVNSATGLSLSGSRFSGVIETQKTEDFKYDTNKKVKSIKVKVGDEVKKGDVLFTYDQEAMKLEIEQAQVEYEKTQNEIETNKLQLAELQKEKAKGNAENQTSLTTQILSLQSDIAKTEYDLKAMEGDIEKKKKNLKKNKVKSTLDGIVKNVADLNTLESSEDPVIVSISRGDDYTVKGTINEQMISQIYTDMPVLIYSRVDDTKVWRGVVSGIETKPMNTNEEEDYYGGEEQGAGASKYNFYVKPETLEGLMLGQHIIIEPDEGGLDEPEMEKDGIWLYSDFLIEEEGKTYVWARNEKERLEKREVTVGRRDEEAGDCEITSGLSKSDMIAYPSDQFEVGMKTTDNYEEANVPENDENEDGDMGDGPSVIGGDKLGEDIGLGDDTDFGDENDEDLFDDEEVGAVDGEEPEE